MAWPRLLRAVSAAPTWDAGSAALSRSYATVEFDHRVEDVVVTDTETAEQGAGPSVAAQLSARRAAAVPRRARLVTRLARTTRQDTKTTSDLTMKVSIAQSPFPLGIERLLNTTDLSVNDEVETVTEEEK